MSKLKKAVKELEEQVYELWSKTTDATVFFDGTRNKYDSLNRIYGNMLPTLPANEAIQMILDHLGFEIKKVSSTRKLVKKSAEKEPKMNFEDVYKGYVIREDGASGIFVGPDTDRYRVVLRAQAARFTKDEALEYIQTGYFCEDSKCGFVIEDAT